jgi:hypothetical protein
MHSVQHVVCNVQCVVCGVHSDAVCTVVQCAVCGVQCAGRVQCAVCGVQCAGRVQCAVRSVPCAICDVQYVVDLMMCAVVSYT